MLANKLELDKPEWLGKRIDQLSDGWRQRVLFYLALVKQPQLLVADEATVGLDSEHRKTLLDLVRKMIDATNMAVVWVTHSYYELFHLKLRALRVERGKLAAVVTDEWECEVTMDGDGDTRFLNLTPDGIIDLFGNLASDEHLREICIKMNRRKAAQGAIL